jgi:hypothetical protein
MKSSSKRQRFLKYIKICRFKSVINYKSCSRLPIHISYAISRAKVISKLLRNAGYSSQHTRCKQKTSCHQERQDNINCSTWNWQDPLSQIHRHQHHTHILRHNALQTENTHQP